MRNRELDSVLRANPDLDERVAEWRQQHPSGTLEQAVSDLELWPKNPRDKDAHRIVWVTLRHLGDPVAVRLGFPAMRAASLLPPPSEDEAAGCTAGTPQAAR